MSLEDEDKVRLWEHWDKGVIFVAALLTLCAIAVCFFEFTITPHKTLPSAAASVSNEVTVRIPPPIPPGSR